MVTCRLSSCNAECQSTTVDNTRKKVWQYIQKEKKNFVGFHSSIPNETYSFVFSRKGSGVRTTLPPLDPRMHIGILDDFSYGATQYHISVQQNEPRHVISNNVTF